MKRKVGFGIVLVTAFGLAVALSAHQRPLTSKFDSLAGKLHHGMHVSEVMQVIHAENIDYSAKEFESRHVILLGSETWQNLFRREKQLTLGFDDDDRLAGSSVDILYQFDEVGWEKFDIE